MRSSGKSSTTSRPAMISIRVSRQHAHLIRESARERARRERDRTIRPGADHQRHGLGLREIETAIQKCSTRELAGRGQPSAAGDDPLRHQSSATPVSRDTTAPRRPRPCTSAAPASPRTARCRRALSSSRRRCRRGEARVREMRPMERRSGAGDRRSRSRPNRSRESLRWRSRREPSRPRRSCRQRAGAQARPASFASRVARVRAGRSMSFCCRIWSTLDTVQ